MLIVLGASNIGLPVVFLRVLAEVPAGAHLITFAQAWGSSWGKSLHGELHSDCHFLPCPFFVWLVVSNGIFDANFAGTLATHGMHFLFVLVGAPLLLMSAAINIGYFRSALINARPKYSSRPAP